LLTEIAGGSYWEDIVRDYQTDIIDGYQAERRFSAEYKQRLRQIYKYVLDMPIRLKPEQRPKYRMIHVSNHEQGCILMVDNMAARKDELFIDIQRGGQLDMFNQTVENDIISTEDIRQKMDLFLQSHINGVHLNVLLASFFTEYGVICKSGDLTDILRIMERSGQIEVARVPATTPKTGKPSSFYAERKGQSVTIRRMRS
jgi:hypothetical protein